MSPKHLLTGLLAVVVTAASFGVAYIVGDAAQSDAPRVAFPDGDPVRVPLPVPPEGAAGDDDGSSRGEGDGGDTGGGSGGSGGGGDRSGGATAPVVRVGEEIRAPVVPSDGVPTSSDLGRTGDTDAPMALGLPFLRDVPVLRFLDHCAAGRGPSCPTEFVAGTILTADGATPLSGGAPDIAAVAGPFAIHAAILDPAPSAADPTFDICRGIDPRPLNGHEHVLAVYSSHPARFTVAGTVDPAPTGLVTAVAAAGGGEVTVVSPSGPSPIPRELPALAFETRARDAARWREEVASTGRPRWIATCYRIGHEHLLGDGQRLRLEGFGTPLPGLGSGGDRFSVEQLLQGRVVPPVEVYPDQARHTLRVVVPTRSDQTAHLRAFGVAAEAGPAISADPSADEAICGASPATSVEEIAGAPASQLRVGARSQLVQAVLSGGRSPYDPAYAGRASWDFRVPFGNDRVVLCVYWTQGGGELVVDRALVQVATPRDAVRLRIDVTRADPSTLSRPVRSLGLEFTGGPGSLLCRWTYRPGPSDVSRDVCPEAFPEQPTYPYRVLVNGERTSTYLTIPACDGPRCRSSYTLLGPVSGQRVAGELIEEILGELTVERQSQVAAGWGGSGEVRSSITGGAVDERRVTPRLSERIEWETEEHEDGSVTYTLPWQATTEVTFEAQLERTHPVCSLPRGAVTSVAVARPATSGRIRFERLCPAEVYWFRFLLVTPNGVRATQTIQINERDF